MLGIGDVAMLIQFSISNFLSFDEKETFSMVAGKTRKNSDRIFNNKKLKLTKCEVILGANASGKSNLISAFQFVRCMVLEGLPRGFANKYFRLDPEKKNAPSEFEIEILCGSKHFVYGFSVVLSTGSILKEYLYEQVSSVATKVLFNRDTTAEIFIVGQYFKNADAIAKLINYGEDSANDQETLFLSIINKNKGKLFSGFPELQILRDIFEWFSDKLNISFPDSILTGYPYFTDTNLDEIAELLNALGTGISELKIVELPAEVIKSKIPDELYNRIVSDLEKANARIQTGEDDCPRIMVRSYKEFYTFEIDVNSKITITTIEFSHENKSVYFDFNEESDGTARLLDLIEILFKISDNRIFIIDEIDRCLHPSMTVKVIELFLSMAKKRNTQLIITSHESRLLASGLLRNDEVCFVCKTRHGASIINPLEKYQLRADKKVYAALFDGTLDAGPSFNDSKLATIIN
jgi:hypothetical protein